MITDASDDAMQQTSSSQEHMGLDHRGEQIGTLYYVCIFNFEDLNGLCIRCRAV